MILHKAAALLRERVDLIAATMTQEQGKIIAEAKTEVLASAQPRDPPAGWTGCNVYAVEFSALLAR